MLPSGVLVKAGLEDLAPSLPDRLLLHGPHRLKVEAAGEDTVPGERSFLEISLRPDGWCLIETTGPDELKDLVVQSLVQTDPEGEVVSCEFRPEKGEYAYTLFREGKLLEAFESRGPSFEAVSFTSELRRVELKELLKASDFMIRSVSLHGIVPGPGTVAGRVRFYVELPGPKSFWEKLLGTAGQK